MPNGRGRSSRFNRGAVVSGSTRIITPEGRIIVRPGLNPGDLTPIPIEFDFVRNIFEPGRPGRAVLRPDDLLALRVELRNIDIVPGRPPRLVAQGRAARLILHFPPQAVTEETFFEVREELSFKEPDADDPAAHPHPNKVEKIEPNDSEALRDPPIRARIADESRLAFKVPDGTEIDYTLDSILAACSRLEPVVSANALPRARRGIIVAVGDLFDGVAVANLPPLKRATLAAQAASMLRIGAGTRSRGLGTLRARQGFGAPGIRPIPDFAAGELRPLPRRRLKPEEPSATTTAIEIPWRLILSPHAGGRWRHAPAPVTSPATGHTELWHTSLVTPGADGSAILPPYPDAERTVRAIWARAGSGVEKMEPEIDGSEDDWPASSELPAPTNHPFRMPLDNNDRFQIVHLSSNFANPDYTPPPVDTKLLMLSSLGGWLDSRGAWDPPGLSVEEWVHRATMARDHYVKVVYRGFLYPFGHRVSLVKVSERKFHNGRATDENRPGNPAYLRQRFFVIIREKVRTFDESAFRATKNKDGVKFAHQFPFSSVEILLDVTPDINDPVESELAEGDARLMFWPRVNSQPFRFPCVGTDLDGRRVAFDLPMIFMDNTRACPRLWNEQTERLVPDWNEAEKQAVKARNAYAAAGAPNSADFDGQQLALAPPLKSGDTSVQATKVVFGGEAEKNAIDDKTSGTLRTYSNDLTRPVFVPKIAWLDARIGVMSGLTGTKESNRLEWNDRYLRLGFNDQTGDQGNQGEVFMDVGGQGRMDFSAQGDRSGGFLQPNLIPRGLSRFAGPIMADVDAFAGGTLEQGAGFSGNLGDLPLPLLFGCIPLGELLEAVTDLAGGAEKIPKFVQEGGSKVETFVNTLIRLYGLVYGLATDPASVARGLIDQGKQNLTDLGNQSQAYAASLVQPVVAKMNQVFSDVEAVATALTAIVGQPVDALDGASELQDIEDAVATARARIAELRTLANTPVAGVSLPAGFRQGVLNVCDKLDQALEALEDLRALIASGAALFEALEDIVGDPAGIGDLFADEADLVARLDALETAIDDFAVALKEFDLINGSVKTTLVNALEDLADVIGAVADIADVLLGDEITLRFDWNPKISSYSPFQPSPPTDPLFRANDPRGLLVAVEGKVKKNNAGSPKISVVCSLRSFDLVLIAPASFIELQFDRIEFSIDSKAKMDVDVLLNEIKFVGPLSFVETLKDLIPLDGFSDPPYLDITPQGIDAGFDIALPTISVGVLNIANMSLGAGFTVPFIGQPLSVRFNFCTREQPFQLTVWMFGGGGFFGITIDPSGVQVLEAAFEFGAAISVDFGVASGGVEVMAGIYFRIENDEATLTGYFRLGGHVDVLGLITASLELYLSLTYESASGKCTGRAELTIEVEVFIFSGSVTVKCERKFAGANGDPSLRQMMGLAPELPLQDELDQIDGAGVQYAWRDYVEAFA